MTDNISIVEPTIDYTKIPPIHQRRTISFINHFIVTTVSFLNKFSLNCENKLYEFENKLQKLEAAIIILESRLASVPALDIKPTVTKYRNDESHSTTKVKDDNVNVREATQSIDETTDEVQLLEVEIISRHPQYKKYFKMVNEGVPKSAVKTQMAEKGLDPSILDGPYPLVLTTTNE